MSKVEKQIVAHCSNPKCNKPVFSDHPYYWCIECGEPLSNDIKNLLPLLPKPQITAETTPAKTFNDPTASLRTGFNLLRLLMVIPIFLYFSGNINQNGFIVIGGVIAICMFIINKKIKQIIRQESLKQEKTEELKQ